METEINNNQYTENKITIQCKMIKTMFRYSKNINEDISFIPEVGIDNPKFLFLLPFCGLSRLVKYVF